MAINLKKKLSERANQVTHAADNRGDNLSTPEVNEQSAVPADDSAPTLLVTVPGYRKRGTQLPDGKVRSVFIKDSTRERIKDVGNGKFDEILDHLVNYAIDELQANKRMLIVENDGERKIINLS